LDIQIAHMMANKIAQNVIFTLNLKMMISLKGVQYIAHLFKMLYFSVMYLYHAQIMRVKGKRNINFFYFLRKRK
jgi:hypothetical protein